MGEDFEGIVDGRMMVASKIVSLEYLWNEVRVRQGAYGTGMEVNSDAKVMFYSYRDPKPAGSLEIYKRAGQFLSREANRNSDYTDYIISTISSYNPLCNEAKKSYIADTQYFRGLNYEMRYKNRREMLEINFEYIREFGENLKARLTGDDKDFVTAVVCGNKSAEEFEKKGFKLYTI